MIESELNTRILSVTQAGTPSDDVKDDVTDTADADDLSVTQEGVTTAVDEGTKGAGFVAAVKEGTGKKVLHWRLEELTEHQDCDPELKSTKYAVLGQSEDDPVVAMKDRE